MFKFKHALPLSCLALVTSGYALAQDPVDRHPVYDVTAPHIHAIQAQATELKVAPVPERRIITGQLFPFDDSYTPTTLKLKAWRGERSSSQLVVSTGGAETRLSATASPLCKGDKGLLPSGLWRWYRATASPLCKGDKELKASIRMIRYTHAGDQTVADIIGNENKCDHAPGVYRAMWFEVNVPQDAEPGVYTGCVTVTAPGCKPVEQPIELEVVDSELPAPAEWKFHLDLWQHPQAVARWHDVTPWTPEHFALLRPLMKRLAEAGQKSITCTLLDEAWNGQTYDTFPSMIRWIRGKDGVMRYDYSALDAWITFMHDEIGIKEQISCYSMLPWHLKVQFMDESTGEEDYLSAEPGKPEFAAVWAPFLRDFHQHMKDKGWAEKTCISIDERADHMVREAMRLVKENAPSFRIASAVDKPSTLTRDVYNISPVLTHAGTALGSLLQERKAAGKITTFYVCLHPQVPNTFTKSAPAEAEWLGFFAAANNLDGFLRWAYNSWNRNPLQSTDFGNWPSGDCFLVYPGNRTSIRFERLRDGIEEYEKINILRARASESPEAAAIIGSMNTRLAAIFTVKRSTERNHAQDVCTAREIIGETLNALNALSK